MLDEKPEIVEILTAGDVSDELDFFVNNLLAQPDIRVPPVRNSTRTPSGSSQRRNVRSCCAARISVGAIRAALAPLSSAISAVQAADHRFARTRRLLAAAGASAAFRSCPAGFPAAPGFGPLSSGIRSPGQQRFDPSDCRLRQASPGVSLQVFAQPGAWFLARQRTHPAPAARARFLCRPFPPGK